MVHFYLKTLDVRCQNISRSIVDVQLNDQNDVDVFIKYETICIEFRHCKENCNNI